MERLTNKREAEAQREGYERRLANGYQRSIPVERFLRLAAYEDSELEPEEVLPKDKADEIALKLMRLADLESLCNYTRLRELAEADRDERVVALPVKPVLTPILSSMLYIIEDGDIYEDALYEAVVGMSESGKTNVVYTTLSDQMIFEQADIGKTVFLTREEAKKALEAMRKEEAT
nr:MAG TPA: hypothetical protein [Caudoviricetes sp.]